MDTGIQAKWDWYEKGGRWENTLSLKQGGTATEAIWRDVDTDKWKPHPQF